MMMKVMKVVVTDSRAQSSLEATRCGGLILKHLLRGELQATAHTWWYHASGANKLAARTLASRKRYTVRVTGLSELVKKRLKLEEWEGELPSDRVGPALPRKLAPWLKLRTTYAILVDTHKVRSNFIYRKCHVR